MPPPPRENKEIFLAKGGGAIIGTIRVVQFIFSGKWYTGIMKSQTSNAEWLIELEYMNNKSVRAKQHKIRKCRGKSAQEVNNDSISLEIPPYFSQNFAKAGSLVI